VKVHAHTGLVQFITDGIIISLILFHRMSNIGMLRYLGRLVDALADNLGIKAAD
jgi:hypothetical protein